MNLTWEEKEKIFEEVKHVHDVQNAKAWAETNDIPLSDAQADECAKRFDKSYSSDTGEYYQMLSIIEDVVNGR